MSNLDVLKDVRQMLDKPEAWIQGAFSGYRQEDGTVEINPDPKYINCWCLTGALIMAIAEDADKCTRPSTLITSKIGKRKLHDLWENIYRPDMLPQNMTLVQWNDVPDRTHADVIQLLDRLKEREPSAQNAD